MPKTAMLPLSDIIHKFDVRIAIDEDRVVQLAVLYEEEEKTGKKILPAITVVELADGKYAYIDGRHRGLAKAFLNLTEIDAVIKPQSFMEDIGGVYSEALKANWGGSKPPTRADISYTVTRMLESGVSQKAIYEKLNFLPRSSCRAFVETAIGNIKKRRVSGAMDAVADGLPLNEAASRFKLKPEILKDAINGKRKKRFGGGSDETQVIVNMKAYITKSLKSANMGIAKRMEGVLKNIEDGEMSSEGASKVLSFWSEHLRKTGLRITDWTARVDAIGSTRDRIIAPEDEAISSVSPVWISGV